MTSKVESAVSLPIYSVLKGEHSETKALITAIDSLPNAFDGGKESLFAKLRRELLSHAKAEHKTVYAKAVERIPKSLIANAEEDHLEIENLLNSLRLSDAVTEEWRTAFGALRQRVERHIQDEEEKIFPEMKEVFSDTEAKQLGKEFDDAKEAELTLLTEADKRDTIT